MTVKTYEQSSGPVSAADKRSVDFRMRMASLHDDPRLDPRCVQTSAVLVCIQSVQILRIVLGLDESIRHAISVCESTDARRGIRIAVQISGLRPHSLSLLDLCSSNEPGRDLKTTVEYYSPQDHSNMVETVVSVPYRCGASGQTV